MSDDRTRQADGLDEHFVALHSGFMLGKYELQAVLGQGGFGITYRAWDAALNRAVAIKEYLPSDVAVRVDGTTVRARSRNDQDSFQWGLERFLEEARALARFEEARAIVRVYDYMQANGTAYMVMALVEGTPLSVLYRREAPLAEERLKAIVLPILDGLEEVHRAGFLHRDIKPSNILIRPSGQPVLIDFGAARQALGEKSRSITSVFTPGYAPFEQYTSSGKQGPWTDIYALAATLYHGIAGRVPVQATDRIREDPLEPAAKIGAGRYSPGFLAAIDDALEVFENRRPQSIAQWRDRLVGRAAALPGTEVPTLDGQGQPAPASALQDRGLQDRGSQSRGSHHGPSAGPASVEPSAAGAASAPRGGRTRAMVLALILALVAAGGYATWSVLDGSRAEEAKAAAEQRAEATAKAQAEAQARAEAERLAREQEDAARRAEEARQRTLEEERQRTEAEARLRAETEARIRAEYEAKAREEAAARRKAEEEEARRMAAEEARRRAEAEKARVEAEVMKVAEAKARAEAEAKAETPAKADAERQRLAQQQAATQLAARSPAPSVHSPSGGIVAPPSSAEIRASQPPSSPTSSPPSSPQPAATQQAAVAATPGFAHAGSYRLVIDCPEVPMSPFVDHPVQIAAPQFSIAFYRDGKGSGTISGDRLSYRMSFTARSGHYLSGSFNLNAGPNGFRGGGMVNGFGQGRHDRQCSITMRKL